MIRKLDSLSEGPLPTAHRNPQDEPPRESNRRFARAKRILDLVLGIPLLICVAPVIAVAAVLIRLTSRGPAIYSQVRMGQFGKCFRIYKLRSMTHDCERHSGIQWSRPGDQRVTIVGKVLRMTHVDELPQLWNVLRGEMSLVGPRPERPELRANLEAIYPRYSERLLVKPGITGLAQILLPADTDINHVGRKLGHDQYYVQHVSLALDLRILLCTGIYLVETPLYAVRKLFLLIDWRLVEAECIAVAAPSAQAGMPERMSPSGE